MFTEDSPPPLPSPPPATTKPIVVRSMYSHNMESKFAMIQVLIDQFTFVSMDTKFPGVVVRSSTEFDHFRRWNAVAHYGSSPSEEKKEEQSPSTPVMMVRSRSDGNIDSFSAKTRKGNKDGEEWDSIYGEVRTGETSRSKNFYEILPHTQPGIRPKRHRKGRQQREGDEGKRWTGSVGLRDIGQIWLVEKQIYYKNRRSWCEGAEVVVEEDDRRDRNLGPIRSTLGRGWRWS
ncbi:hypothetical protein U1Q18_014278 [Sarracenia purpurea var. burkii]